MIAKDVSWDVITLNETYNTTNSTFMMKKLNIQRSWVTSNRVVWFGIQPYEYFDVI